MSRRPIARPAVKRSERQRKTFDEVAGRCEPERGAWAGGCRHCGTVVDNVPPDAPRSRCGACGMVALDGYDAWALGGHRPYRLS